MPFHLHQVQNKTTHKDQIPHTLPHVKKRKACKNLQLHIKIYMEKCHILPTPLLHYNMYVYIYLHEHTHHFFSHKST